MPYTIQEHIHQTKRKPNTTHPHNAPAHLRAAEAQLRLSMSGTGHCYDNASAEGFFATLKLEAIRGPVFTLRAEARQEIFDYIEVVYNQQRLHSGIDYARPVSRID